MKIYTGNFANVNKYKEAGIFPISIALSCKYFFGNQFLKLAPEWSFMNSSREVYLAKFAEKLSRYDPATIVEELKKISQGKDVVMLCHEKEGDFCHRHLVADWMNKHLNLGVVELGKMEKKKEKKKPPFRQMSLF